ncbi:YbjQ family protein [[Clostridium] hylemonae]|nr:heavy metal-binding domain-containing protein [[Clostridium] hylemonae]
MPNCCICGRKISDSFLENKYKLPYGLYGCYQCADMFEKIKKAENAEQIQKAQDNIKNKMAENSASQEAVKAVEEEFKKLEDNRQCMTQRKLEEAEIHREQQARKNKLMVTTGYNFEGYRISRYIDIVHGEYSVGHFINIDNSLSRAKYAAQEKMIDQAVVKGANAIIGIDFDITSISDVIAAAIVSGTAVVIEKIEE